jgi:ketosteroid isomerase-like protein
LDKERKTLHSDMRRGRPPADPILAALEAAKRMATEVDTEEAVSEAMDDLAAENLGGKDLRANDPASHDLADSAAGVCPACGYRNREGNRFCGKCGTALPEPQSELMSSTDSAEASITRPFPGSLQRERQPGAASGANRVVTAETHHYHHHYHYFQGGAEGSSTHAADPAREAERMRPSAALRGDMSRAEAAVRRITQEWVLACNTKHLDDLLDLYVADALVLRSNYPPIRGAAAVREFFFGALDAGLGDAEMEPLRVEISGDLAYEAGRCKALVPGATGKRREERGKYLWVCARQSNGEWKLAADCWSSDLGFSLQESDVPAGTTVKTREPRKT